LRASRVFQGRQMIPLRSLERMRHGWGRSGKVPPLPKTAPPLKNIVAMTRRYWLRGGSGAVFFLYVSAIPSRGRGPKPCPDPPTACRRSGRGHPPQGVAKCLKRLGRNRRGAGLRANTDKPARGLPRPSPELSCV
jgi:hypothetical protein